MTGINDNMSFDEAVPSESKYLSKSDVGEDGVILTIKAFTRDTLKSDDGEEEKTVMHFVEPGYKPMIVNRTNAQLLPIVTGAKNVGEAKGKKVVVYNDPTIGFGGKITGGIRLKKVAGEPRQASREPGADDDIGF